MSDNIKITAHSCGVPELCRVTGKEHDWTGKWVSQNLPSGGSEGFVTCKDCGVGYKDFMMWNDFE